MDACLRDRYSLLLHCFMDGNLIFDVHLVELVNTTDPMICQHESASFNTKLARLRVLPHTRSETSCITRLAATVDSSGHKLADVLEELTLRCGWVSNDANIDIASQLDLVFGFFLDPSEKL